MNGISGISGISEPAAPILEVQGLSKRFGKMWR